MKQGFPIHLLKQGHLQPLVHDHAQRAVEGVQGLSLHRLTQQPLLVFGRLYCSLSELQGVPSLQGGYLCSLQGGLSLQPAHSLRDCSIAPGLSPTLPVCCHVPICWPCPLPQKTDHLLRKMLTRIHPSADSWETMFVPGNTIDLVTLSSTLWA